MYRREKETGEAWQEPLQPSSESHQEPRGGIRRAWSEPGGWTCELDAAWLGKLKQPGGDIHSQGSLWNDKRFRQMCCAKSLSIAAPVGVMTELPSQLFPEEGQVLKTYSGLNGLISARRSFQPLRDSRTAVGYLLNVSRVAGRGPIPVKAQVQA